MSKHNHSAIAHKVGHIINEVSLMSNDEIRMVHGIEIYDNGKIYDQTYNQTFESIGEWATFNVEQDNVLYEEHFHGKNQAEY